MEQNENEVWKPIKGYEGLYEVSDMGRVKSLEKRVRHVSRIKHAEGVSVVKERILKRRERRASATFTSGLSAKTESSRCSKSIY